MLSRMDKEGGTIFLVPVKKIRNDIYSLSLSRACMSSDVPKLKR